MEGFINLLGWLIYSGVYSNFHLHFLLSSQTYIDILLKMLLVLLTLILQLASCKGTVSLDDLAICLVQRACVRDRLYWLPDNVGCGGSMWYNDCFCRDGTSATALSYLSSAVPRVFTSNTIDLKSAILVCTTYRNGAMGNVAPAITEAEAATVTATQNLCSIASSICMLTVC